jgi:hypothetical protein
VILFNMCGHGHFDLTAYQRYLDGTLEDYEYPREKSRSARGAPAGSRSAMPRLACWSCGRQIHSVAPLESLFAEERRCHRCGASLNPERRDAERRSMNRRQGPPDDPGPPDGVERRVGDRREGQRRTAPRPGARPRHDAGWQD